ncbi:MAG: radical SAM protein [Bacteroidetes bacterium]|nr:radical SAM protein [Bacteroidota bacterium]
MTKLTNLYRRSVAFKRLLTPEKKPPVYLLQFVTNRCNAACDHCFYWRELNEKVKDELSLAEYEKIATSLGPMLQVTLTGGSPELRADLPEIAEIYSRICRPANITFCMLGFSTSRIVDQMEKILTRMPHQRFTVAISLDGIGEEHDKLRRLDGCFNRVVETFKQLGEMKKKYKNLRLAVGTVVQGLNFETVANTALWARQNLPIDLLKPILVRGNPLNSESKKDICVETYLDVIDRDKQWMNGTNGGMTTAMDYVIATKENIQRDLIAQIAMTKLARHKCSGGRETAVIYPDGNVAGCELRDDILGNVREVNYDFNKIWLGEKGDAFRATTGKVEACQGCYHHCFLSPTVFRTPALWPKVAQSALHVYRNNHKRKAKDYQVINAAS